MLMDLWLDASHAFDAACQDPTKTRVELEALRAAMLLARDDYLAGVQQAIADLQADPTLLPHVAADNRGVLVKDVMATAF